MMRVTRSSARKSVASQEKKPEKETRTRRAPRKIVSSSESEDEEENILMKPCKNTPTKQKSRCSESDMALLSPVTPPKQPKTDRKELTMTPSSMLKTLTLISPKKRVKETVSKKALFHTEPEENDKCEERVKVGKYQNARKALHSNFPTDMPGREKEIQEISEFIKGHLENESSGSIYISGPPGTGKTASLNLILEQEDINTKVQQIYVNCTAIKSATSVYSRLNKELNLKVTGKSEKDNLAAFEKYLKQKHKTVLIVLDEIDQLETKNHSILYTIFELPSRLNSKIILVGIANALDLTDRMLPRLQARCELKPRLLHFAPYTKEQIVHIFTSRLKEAGVLDVFSPVALQMLAGKVASISGDVRRALDIGRRVVELIDENKKSDIFKSVENFVVEESKKVNYQEVICVLNNVYGTSQNLADDCEEAFPLQQKIVVCSLLLIMKKAKNKDVTVGKLHEIYSRVCQKRNLTSVDQAEFVGLCQLIETKGIIRVSGKKEPRLHKITLEWNENEVSEALKDKQLISTILQDENCLGKL
ncbi:cell division control protein 6 homolog [Anthonomus grandis grandis]|uniref:cell division control protein 6 homolog n=1 Tax=Anthonomus grandis grandis TaxID=2921223 RepID=UPI0021663541|nr:cell division control protein 6 homolog [Anthonomus grandis grandis]